MGRSVVVGLVLVAVPHLLLFFGVLPLLELLLVGKLPARRTAGHVCVAGEPVDTDTVATGAKVGCVRETAAERVLGVIAENRWE